MKTVKQNQLVFRGTRKEVEAAPSIDRCWYLAWDTGEIFVGNNVGSKTPYGGKANSLSEIEIKKIINELFKSYQDQISEHNKILVDANNRITKLEKRLNEIYDLTEQHIQDTINEMQSTKELEFITRDDLDNYISTEYIQTSVMQVVSGEDLASRAESKEYGFYLCNSYFNDDKIYEFNKGSIYFINTQARYSI